MFYSIRHLTKFRYSAPVSESVMELRMNPRSEGPQRCLSFQVNVTPRVGVRSYRDYLGNVVHHFDVPSAHRQLTIIAEAMVDVAPQPVLPADLGPDVWERLDAHIAARDFWEMLAPSQFAQWTDAIENFARELDLPTGQEVRRRDPLEVLLALNSAVYEAIAYVPKSTRVDSPVDDALLNRQGVCQDYSHIMIALVRRLGIPCRYVSGYLFHRTGEKTRSSEGATHAWVEAYLPDLGWIGLDPTNNVLAGETHVRTAVGRDYADVPPTRGVFKGGAASELTVAVRVAPSDKPPPPETAMESEDWSSILQNERVETEADAAAAEQQQQQQQ
jgi:transglutaminase-like putative cysteine protease